MLKDVDYGVFIVASIFIAGMMQFYFLGTAQFMQDNGVSAKNVPASMALAQAVQAVATLALLGLLYRNIGPNWTLTLGAASWLALYSIYVFRPERGLIVLAQAFHGLAYVLFIIAGQMYVNDVAPAAISGSAQSLLSLVTNGIGLFLGTQAAGIIMDRFSVGGKFQWRKIWSVPMVVILIGTLALAGLFRGAIPKKDVPAGGEPAKIAAVMMETGDLPG